MHLEVGAAINLIAGSLYNKLPRRRVNAFAEEVEKGIFNKFQGHWYPGNPSKGAAYRCVNVTGEKIDPLFIYAARNSGTDLQEVLNYLPKDLTIWIDPGEVSFSVGEKGSDKEHVRILYSERRAVGTGTMAAPLADLTDDVAVRPPVPPTFPATMPSAPAVSTSPLSSPDELTSNLSSSLGSLSLSSGGGGSNGSGSTPWGKAPSPISWPTTSTTNPWTPMSPSKSASLPSWSVEPSPFNSATNPLPPPQPMQHQAFTFGGPPMLAQRSNVANSNNKTMTAAMFAQTKFGSTKFKNQAKRSSRLSPTENCSRSMPGSYHNSHGQGRHNPTMTAAFFDRMQNHMSSYNNDFPIDHFKLSGGNSFKTRTPTSRFQMAPTSMANESTSLYSDYSPNSPLSDLFSTSHQDWVDLSDIVLPSSGNPLLAA